MGGKGFKVAKTAEIGCPEHTAAWAAFLASSSFSSEDTGTRINASAAKQPKPFVEL